MELMVTRIAQRLALKEETLWARLDELRRSRRPSASHNEVWRERNSAAIEEQESPRARSAPALPEERRLVEVLLAEPDLVLQAAGGVMVDEVAHPGLRRLLGGLYALAAMGEPPTLDVLRASLEDNAPLVNKAFELQEAGLARADRRLELEGLLARFRQRREKSAREELQSQLHSVRDDDEAALDLLRRLQKQSQGAVDILEPGAE